MSINMGKSIGQSSIGLKSIWISVSDQCGMGYRFTLTYYYIETDKKNNVLM